MRLSLFCSALSDWSINSSDAVRQLAHRQSAVHLLHIPISVTHTHSCISAFMIHCWYLQTQRLAIRYLTPPSSCHTASIGASGAPYRLTCSNSQAHQMNGHDHHWLSMTQQWLSRSPALVSTCVQPSLTCSQQASQSKIKKTSGHLACSSDAVVIRMMRM